MKPRHTSASLSFLAQSRSLLAVSGYSPRRHGTPATQARHRDQHANSARGIFRADCRYLTRSSDTSSTCLTRFAGTRTLSGRLHAVVRSSWSVSATFTTTIPASLWTRTQCVASASAERALTSTFTITLPTNRTPRMTATPNHALQRTAPCVTAPASTAAFSTRHAGAAPHSAVAEPGVVSRCYPYMTSEYVNIVVAVVAGLATALAAIIKNLAATRMRAVRTANSAPRPSSPDPFQPALDRLNDVRRALDRQKSFSRTNRWTSGSLTFGQYIIGGLLASSFVQQSLNKELVGVLGLLVLVSSLMYQHFRPDIQLRGALGRAHRLRALIRQSEDDLYSMQSQAPNAPNIDDFRRRLSTALSEIEASELQDITITKDSGDNAKDK